MKTILLVGNLQKDLIEYPKRRGYKIININNKPALKSYADIIFSSIVTEITSKEDLLNAVRELNYPIDGVIALYENAILPKAWLSNYFNLPGMSEYSALAITDKAMMRERFINKYPEISPNYCEIKDESDLINFAREHTFPLMLKPANLVKSLLVNKCNDEKELLNTFKDMQQIISQIYLANGVKARQPKIIVEEFLNGPMYTVAGFVDAKKSIHLIDSIVEVKTASDEGYDDNFLYSRKLPANINQSSKESIYNIVKKGIEALNISSLAIHAEVMLTTDGPKIIEIGGRIGGYRNLMYKNALGIDLYDLDLDIALGLPIETQITKNEAFAAIELFPSTNGLFKEVTHLDRLKLLKSLRDINITVKPGDEIGKAKDGYRTACNINLQNQDAKILEADLNFIRAEIKVLTI